MDIAEIDDIRALINQLGKKTTIQDFEEHIQLTSVRESVRTWYAGSNLEAFAYVDDFANLCFEIVPGRQTHELEAEIIAWGATIQAKRNLESGEGGTLDASCSADDESRIAILKRNGFVQQPIRSIHYELDLPFPFTVFPFPAGYTWRSVKHSDAVEDLAALHRQAFGTDHMTAEYRQAMMCAPQYLMDLDLLAIAPDGSLAGFCVCSIDETDPALGYTDPIGVHPLHQHKGLALALVSAGINLLQQRDVARVQTGTSSENSAMQELAHRLGFKLVSENVWFSLDLDTY